MPSGSLSKLHSQLGRVRRRLLFQSFLNHLVWCCAGALLLAALWFVARPFVMDAGEPWLAWAILGGAAGLGFVAALAVTIVRAPSQLQAALALDDKFVLKERVTTSLTLTEEQLQSPAGQALLQDVQKHVGSLQVGAKFPIRVSWKKLALPVVAAVLAVLAVFFEPDLSWLRSDSNNANTLNAAEAEVAKNHLAKLTKFKKKKKENILDSKDLKEIEAEFKKLTEQQVDPKNKEQLREQAQKIRNLEEKMKNRLDQLEANKNKKNRLQQQMDLLKAMAQRDKIKDGPAKEMLEALRKREMQQFQEELKKLEKQIADKKLNKDQLKKLEQQLRDLQKELQRLEDERQQKKEQLEREKDLGNLDQEQLEQLQREIEQLEDMDDLQDLIQQCRNCAKAGAGKKLSRALRKMAGKLQKLDGDLKKLEDDLDELELSDDEFEELEQNAKLLEEVREGLCRCIGGQGGAGGLGGGKRPEGKKEPTNAIDTKNNPEIDPKGEFRIEGFSRGGSFKRIPAKEVPGTFQRTAQEAQRAIETQRISPDAAEMLKGYYENLGGRSRKK